MFLNKEGIEKNTVFLFPGNGIHQNGMLTKLSTVSAIIKDTIEEFAEGTDKYTDIKLLDEIEEDAAVNQLRIIAAEAAVCRLWERSGLSGDIFIGHSLGEYAAAYCAGILDSESLVKILSVRNEILAHSVGKLRMCSVSCTVEELEDLKSECGANFEIAAYNSPKRLTLVGSSEDYDRFIRFLNSRKIEFFPIQIDGGSHSSMYEQYREQFLASLGDVSFGKPEASKRIFSTVIPDGNAEDMCSLEYWFRHMTSPVRFSQAVRRAVGANAGMFADLGVSPDTLGIAMNNVKEHGMKWIASVRCGQNYKKQLRSAFDQVSGYGITMAYNFD